MLPRAAALGVFLLLIVAGWIGTPVGSRNAAIVTVWIAWWAVLMLLAVPLLGRTWCAVCPVPVPGEWLQQGSVLGGPVRRSWSFGWRWPRRLRSTWLQNALFLAVTLFGTTVLTQPRATAAGLALLLVGATATALVFERRAFCRHLCPLGGFIGVSSQGAPLALRVIDTAVCAGHREKSCVTGSTDGTGCPWNVFPGALDANIDCGLCLECVRVCPSDNIALTIRPFGGDFARRRAPRFGEAFKSLIILGSAAAYSAVMLGPWNGLKIAAADVGSAAWWSFAAAFVATVAGVLPALFTLAVRSGGRRLSGEAVARFANTAVPLGLAAWMAFTLALIAANGSYVAPVMSDPLGRGWDLLGTAATAWQPRFMRALPVVQAALLLGGFLWSSVLARRVALAHDIVRRRGFTAPAPVILFHAAVTVVMLWLLVG